MSVFQSNLIITLIFLRSITMWNSRLKFSQPSDPTSLSACQAEAHAHDLGGLGSILTTCRQLQRLVSSPFCHSRPVAPLIVAAEMLVLQCSDYRLLPSNVSLSRLQHGYRQYATGKKEFLLIHQAGLTIHSSFSLSSEHWFTGHICHCQFPTMIRV